MPSGQGFGVLADQDASGSPLTFTNSMRVADNNGTVRSSDLITNKLWLKISDEKEILNNSTLIGFLEAATPLFDKGYDSERLDTKLSLYSTLENGKELSIQGREAFQSNTTVTLGFATAIEDVKIYTISIDKIEGVDLDNSQVYLKDHLTGTIVNLKKESYNFTSGKTSQSNRFTLSFEPEEIEIATSNELSNNTELALYPNPTQGIVTLSYIGDEKFNNAIITNINGKIIKKVDLSSFNESLDIDLSRFSIGMYFIKISTENTLITKKILLK
jgi:hypothetical protein